MGNGSNTDRKLSRRRWLESIGVTGTAAFAGCMGDDEESGADPGVEENGDGNGNGDSQRLNYMRGGELFADLQWNQFGQQHNGSIKNFVDTVTALTRSADGEIAGFGYDDWEYDPDSQILSVTIRDDITFWNGDSYDAEDLWTFEELYRLQNPEASSFESIDVAGDYTVEYTTKEPRNPEILTRLEVTDAYLEFGADVWGEWLERYQDASDAAARDEITGELTEEWEITTEQLVDEGLGTGPYVIDDITDEYMDLSAHEEHPVHAGNAEQYDPNIEQIRIWYAEETGRREQFISNERVDFAGHGHTWDTFKDQLPDYWEPVVQAPRINPRKMIINWRNREYLQDVNVRRAMAAAMDYQNIATNAGNEAPVEMHSGMATSFNEQYWGEEIPSDFIDYGETQDYDLADEFLSRSGYERDDGQIYDPDGNPLDEARFIVGGSPWGDIAQTAAHQLDQYGFPIDINGVDRSTKLEIVEQDMGDWDLSTETHYAGITHHPHEYFRPNSFWGWRIGPATFGPLPEFDEQVPGWLEEGRTHSPYNGKPMVFEVPSDVGSENLDGDTTEINIYDLYQEIQGPVGEERDREIIQNLSWAWNYMLPDIDCTFALAETFGNTQRMEFGAEEDLESYNAPHWPQMGLVRHRE